MLQNDMLMSQIGHSEMSKIFKKLDELMKESSISKVCLNFID